MLPPELTKKAVATLVDAVFAELGDYFVKAKVTRRATPRFTYPGFGTFTKKRKNGRAGRNPQTGAPIVIPPSMTVDVPAGAGAQGVPQPRSAEVAGLSAAVPVLALDPTTELTDLHIHVGGAVAPHILWAIAHDSGFKLPVKSYWDFCELVYADPQQGLVARRLPRHHAPWTERIQSSPAAIERSIYEVIGKEYRSSRVSTIELRFNPMKRNLGGERDLDYIIAAALRGMDRACLDYGVKAGLIFCLAREFDYELNEIIVRKAEKYRDHGVIGIDLAGPEQHTLELGGDVDRYRDLFARARAAGLGTTVHTGETTHTGAEGVLAVIDKLKPARIGHGIAAAQSRRGDAQAGRAAASCSSSAPRRTCARTRSPTSPSCGAIFDRLARRRRAPDHQHRRHLPPRHDAAQGVRPAARRRHRLASRGARATSSNARAATFLPH